MSFGDEFNYDFTINTLFENDMDLFDQLVSEHDL